MTTALVVDDHPFVRAGVRLFLEKEGFQVVGEADNGADALQLAREKLPNIILLDIGIPKLDGLEVISRIAALELPVKVLVLTAQPAEYFATRCINAGAVGYVSKLDDMSGLTHALKAVMSGYSYFPNKSVRSSNHRDIRHGEAERIDRLSNRELVVLQQLAKGASNKDIATAMLLSSKTISTYKTRLINKLKVTSVVDLADLAKRNGLI